MTINDLNERKRKADRAISLMEKRSEEISGPIIDAVKGTKAENRVRELLGLSAMNTADIMEELRQYSRLLEEIMRVTEITWPPACKLK